MRLAARPEAAEAGAAADAAPAAAKWPADSPRGESQVYINPRGGVEEDYPLDAHTRNFLDCMKSRQKPNAHMEIGYHSALPCLLALGRRWRKAKPRDRLGRQRAREQGALTRRAAQLAKRTSAARERAGESQGRRPSDL